jgi:signal transduction histidine kinase
MCTALAFQPMLISGRSGSPRSRTREESVALTERLRLTMATAGHDLRQPLQIILGAVERLGRLASDDADRMWLNAARNQVTRLSDGLEDLTDAARQPRTECEGPSMQAVRVGDVLSEIALEFQPAATSRGLKLRSVDSSVVMMTDPGLLACALRNLVSNALKYTRHGGVVIGCRQRRGGLRIDVVDSGLGIAAEDCRHIFDAYRQVDARADGIGLGLYLVHTHCSTLGFKLDCESEIGRGSRFSIGVPAASIASTRA